MKRIRKQLTLFVNEPDGAIEKIRAQYNSVQFNLIRAHVTLCREDEIEPIENTIERLQSISFKKPIRIQFKKAERFSNGKGVFLSSSGRNEAFRELRKLALGQQDLNKEQIPHITLMHPRNSTCYDKTFEQIKNYDIPTELEFSKISLIQQINEEKWTVLKEFNICS